MWMQFTFKREAVATAHVFIGSIFLGLLVSLLVPLFIR
jgi:hypothetical protein